MWRCHLRQRNKHSREKRAKFSMGSWLRPVVISDNFLSTPGLRLNRKEGRGDRKCSKPSGFERVSLRWSVFPESMGGVIDMERGNFWGIILSVIFVGIWWFEETKPKRFGSEFLRSLAALLRREECAFWWPISKKC